MSPKLASRCNKTVYIFDYSYYMYTYIYIKMYNAHLSLPTTKKTYIPILDFFSMGALGATKNIPRWELHEVKATSYFEKLTAPKRYAHAMEKLRCRGGEMSCLYKGGRSQSKQAALTEETCFFEGEIQFTISQVKPT